MKEYMQEYHKLTAKLSQLLEDSQNGKDVSDSEIDEIAMKAAEIMFDNDIKIQERFKENVSRISKREGWDYEATRKMTKEIYLENGVAELKRILDPETSEFELKEEFRNIE